MDCVSTPRSCWTFASPLPTLANASINLVVIGSNCRPSASGGIESVTEVSRVHPDLATLPPKALPTNS